MEAAETMKVLAEGLGLEAEDFGRKWFIYEWDWNGDTWVVRIVADKKPHEVYLSHESVAALHHHWLEVPYFCDQCGAELGMKKANPWGNVRETKPNPKAPCSCPQAAEEEPNP